MSSAKDAVAKLAEPALNNSAMDDAAWVEVIQTMERIYAELVDHQIELEHKNTALVDAQRFVDSVLSAMSDVLVVCDMQGKIQECNAALLALTGQQANDLVGVSLDKLFPPEHSTKLLALFDSDSVGTAKPIELNMLNTDGEPVPLLLSCTARINRHNKPAGRVVTGHPIGKLQRAYSELNLAHEALKEAQHQLIQSEKMASLGRLVAGVAHELNNPVSFVLGNVHALKRYEQRLNQYLDAVHQADSAADCGDLRASLRIDHIRKDMQPLIDGSIEGAERVTEIIQHLRHFAAPGPRQQQRFDVVALIHNALQWVSRSQQSKPAIALDCPPELYLSNSEGHVHQIMINLLQNSMDALEHSDAPAAISVQVTVNDKQALIEVADSGPGIAEEDLLRIFDPFFTTKPIGKGTGLGLSISYGLATGQCGGGLSASNRPDGGALFSLTLPLDAEGKDKSQNKAEGVQHG